MEQKNNVVLSACRTGGNPDSESPNSGLIYMVRMDKYEHDGQVTTYF